MVYKCPECGEEITHLEVEHETITVWRYYKRNGDRQGYQVEALPGDDILYAMCPACHEILIDRNTHSDDIMREEAVWQIIDQMEDEHKE